MKEEEFWLVSTDHMEDRIWFRDDEDYTKGMNIVAILASTVPVNIYAFVLMSNHVHFLIKGTHDDADNFIRRYKKQYSQFYSIKYGAPKGLLRKNGVDIREVPFEDESFERAVAYVQMNPVAANICLNASGYPWGTGDTFFRAVPVKGFSIGTLSVRAQRRVLHSKVSVPHGFLICDDGFVTPNSYVHVRFVESVFRTPKRMNYFLTTSSKARKIKELPSFSDQSLASAIKDLSISQFRKNGLSEMSEGEKTELLRQIRFRFSCDVAQLARVCGLKYDEVSRLLESFQ